MKLLEFLPAISRKIQLRFSDVAYRLLCYESHSEINSEMYLILYVYSGDMHRYKITDNIKSVLCYVSEYGKDCQVVKLNIGDKPIVELLY